MDDVDYINPETIGGTNLFAYCNNNPVMQVDETGNMPKWLSTAFKIVTGVAVVATALVGKESLLRMAIPSVVLVGAGGVASGLYGKYVSNQYNFNGDFWGW